MFKGKPAPGKSAVSPSEVVASYRRQAEQELNSERVPAALKETIKNYFLSLGEERQVKTRERDWSDGVVENGVMAWMIPSTPLLHHSSTPADLRRR